MDIHPSYSPIHFRITTLLILLFALTYLPPSLCRHSKEFKSCKQTFNCANLTDISYPFYGLGRPSYCGHPGFELLGCNNTDKPQLMIKSQTFLVIAINSTLSTITVARQDYFRQNGCPSTDGGNITIDFRLFQYTPVDENITVFYNTCASACSSGSLKAMSFPCPMTATQNRPVCYLTEKMMVDNNISGANCSDRLFFPVQRPQRMNIDKSGEVIQVSFATWAGFELKLKADNVLCQQCVASGGQCGHDSKLNKFFCFCTDESKCPFPGSIPDKEGHTSTKPQIIMLVSFSALGAGILILIATFFLIKRFSKENYIIDSQTGRRLDVEAFLRYYGFPEPRRYSYKDLKKITNSFKEKLGEGGYGTVYKGKLHSGHMVAVKILKKTKENPEEFINEVVSIGRTNHINVVTLMGFCYDGQKKALVYDFMPNGSLEKFIYGGVNHQKLSWDILYQIAVGIARGLEYLHRGCNTRILHFDIKPHNILLDEHFCPKISDFGLAKLCPLKESIISMSEARGTVGYIAPEVFLRNFGRVSNKSDVYSYGMLVLEMVGCRRKAEAEVEDSAELYFPEWIYRQLEGEDEEFDCQEVLSDDEVELQRKLIMVSLWCVQTNPSSRPAMTKVVEMLEGSLELLQIPPIPFSSSSLRLQSQSSTTKAHHDKQESQTELKGPG